MISTTTGQEVLPLRKLKRTVNGHSSHEKSKSALLSDAILLQKEMKEQALADETPVHHKAACVRAWTDLAERIRILRGQPLPGQLRPTGEPKSKAKRGARGAELVKPANVVACGVTPTTGSAQNASENSPAPQAAQEPVNTKEASGQQ